MRRRGRGPRRKAWEQLCRLDGGMFPRLIVADHCIEGYEHLSHKGDGSDLGRLSGGDETLVEGAEWGFAAGGGTRGHVERGSHRGAPTGDGSCSAASVSYTHLTLPRIY